MVGRKVVIHTPVLSLGMRLTLIRVRRNSPRRSESIYNLNLVAVEVVAANEVVKAVLGVVLLISNIHAKVGCTY